jgi:hypothetical protein
MTLEHEVAFDLNLNLPPDRALAFVRDVPLSLSRADFLRSLRVEDGVVYATLPVNAALFGQRLLPFESALVTTRDGAQLLGRPLEHDGPGWAWVDGEAHVGPGANEGSRVHYRFRVKVHLRLPEAERWGGQALLRMIGYTAQTVLERVTAAFPAAIEAAARELELTPATADRAANPVNA